MRQLIIYALAVLFSVTLFSATATAQPGEITISNPTLSLLVDYTNKASIRTLVINGQKVINATDGIFTSVKSGGIVYSSLHLRSEPVLEKTKNAIVIDKITYGDDNLTILEKWTFTPTAESITWDIERSYSRSLLAEEAESPVFNFDNMDIWEGAYQGYGGLAWFYLFNEKLSTYGVHTRSSSFWNSRNGNGLNISVDAPGKEVGMKYTRTIENKLAYTVSVSDKALLPLSDSGTNRRRFIKNGTSIWAPFYITPGKSAQRITMSFFDFNKKYGRGRFVGINGSQVSAVLNTIARIGVIDSLHFGGNSWHTPYGPICLHEQYIAQLGLGINDPSYLKGYQSCLDFYRDHAIKPDGRVYSRWAYNDEDMMLGQGNKEGFYEARWGILMDSNPDLVSNVAELYDMTGDVVWVKSHQLSCEAALDWILKRDENGNGLVEMMTDSTGQKMSSDWIDIIWASYENAFVNAKLYHALVKWAAIEYQLDNPEKGNAYRNFAAKLKISFNRPTREGGFWDEEKGCYVHWIDKDGSVHGRNMVTPVNFMAIAYGICDDEKRRRLILDNIEKQMQQEKLFFWPLAMESYAPGDGKEWQFPFPNYENGDLFLSWGSIAVKAYAEYKPELAVRYVKNVLEQYSKDGLAFQRYGRSKQDGLGDDILSGNSLAIVGLYASVYGINPLYNRLFLDPHITPELAGTELYYNFRNERLTIRLDSHSYAVSNKKFKMIAGRRFGFFATKEQLFYFDGGSAIVALQVKSEQALTLSIKNWKTSDRDWMQTIDRTSSQPLLYTLHQLKPNTAYLLSVNGRVVEKKLSDGKGDLVISHKAFAVAERLTVSLEN